MKKLPRSKIKNPFRKTPASKTKSTREKMSRKDKVLVRIAVIGLIGTLFTALATIISAAIQVTGTKKTCPVCPEIDWRQIAHTWGWIPRSECPWEKFEGTGADGLKKQVKVEIKLLSGENRWVCGLETEAELGKVPVDLRTHIRGLERNPDTKIIVAVGMASVEGTSESQSELSKKRSDMLRGLLLKEFGPDVPVHGLSLGQYSNKNAKSGCKITSDQRRVVVVSVIKQDDGVNLAEAVPDALIDARNSSNRLPFDIRDYEKPIYREEGFGFDKVSSR